MEPWLVVRFQHCRPEQPAGHRRIIMLERGRLDVGMLDYQICHQCRVGCINKLSITDDWQRRGLGSRALRHALVRGRGYDWVTSGQSPEGKAFFAAMARKTGVVFRECGGSCSHIHAAR